MGDIFLTKEAQDVLAGKHIAVIGGSNMRGLYKDIVWLLNTSTIIPYEVLGEKLEKNFPDFDSPRWKNKRVSKRLRKIFHDDNKDCCLKSEELSLHPGRTYQEPRFYHHDKKDISVSFRFVTRVWSQDSEEWFRNYESVEGAQLDVIIMNSILWDVNRWGPNYATEFKENLDKLLKTVSEILSPDGMFIWLTAQPGSKDLNSKAMEIPGLEFQKRTTRYNVIEANFYAAHKVAEAGFDVIDMHYYYLLQTFRRNKDGIHWSPEANRYATNLLLTHISLAKEIPLPGRNKDDFACQRTIFMSDVSKGHFKSEKSVKKKLKELDNLAESMVKDYKDMIPSLQELKGDGPPQGNFNNQMPPHPGNMHPGEMGQRFHPYPQRGPGPGPGPGFVPQQVYDYNHERPGPWMRGQGPPNMMYNNGPPGPGPMGMGQRPMGMGPGPIMGPGGRMRNGPGAPMGMMGGMGPNNGPVPWQQGGQRPPWNFQMDNFQDDRINFNNDQQINDFRNFNQNNYQYY